MVDEGVDDPRILAVGDLVDHVRAMLPRLISSRNRRLLPRQYAAAALARCNRQLSAMIELLVAGYPDAQGLIMRPLVECWYVGTYFLEAPDEALNAINAAYADQMGTDDERWGDLNRFADQPGVDAPEQIRWHQLAARVDELYDQQGGVNLAKRLYEVLYRDEPLMSIHGGLGSIAGHVDDTGVYFLRIFEVPRESDEGELRILLAAPLVEALARGVTAAFDLDHSAIDRIGAAMSAEIS